MAMTVAAQETTPETIKERWSGTLLLPALSATQANGRLQIHQINVGQGDAALIISPLGTLVAPVLTSPGDADAVRRGLLAHAPTKRKAGISRTKATGAVLTLGWSLLATDRLDDPILL